MSDPRPALRPFVEALARDADGRLWLAGVPARALPAGAEPGDDLALCAYERAYARGFPPVDPPPRVDEGDIAPLLAAANATVDRTEPGWVVARVEADGTVLAERNGRRQRLPPGRYLATDGVAPPRPGSAVMAGFPGGSSALQFGFHHCFGAARRDADDASPLVRLYFNVRLASAVDLVRRLTAALNRYEIPFEFKIVTRTLDYGRRDAAVLYVGRDLFPIVALVVASILPDIAGALDAAVPLFTKPLADGIGLAEDPAIPGESFGTARCRLIASSLAAAREGARFSYPAFAREFARLAADGRLRLDALWLNPGSTDAYALPSLGAAGRGSP